MDETVQTAKPEVSEPSDARAALVTKWRDRVTEAKDARKDVFDAMRKAMQFAYQGCDDEWRKSGAYRVPILPRYINQAVSSLYARNPKTVWQRKQRLMYKLWDGRPDSMQAAMEMAAMGDGQSMAIVQEMLAVRQEQALIDKMGQTASILWQYYLDEQSANFKQQLKAAVRRTKVAKVAWIKLGYQRAMQENPEVIGKMDDITSKLSAIEDGLKDMQSGEDGDDTAEMEQLRLNLADLERDKMMVVKEGPVLDFPRSDAIIVSTDCVHLKSLAGASFIAQEYEFTKEKVHAVYGAELPESCKWRKSPSSASGKTKPDTVLVWEVWDRENQQVLTLADDYDDFLKEPATPDVWMERFYPFFPIVFNEVEHYEEIYPLSDVEQAEHIQKEYNRAREGLRNHRIAAQPYWVQGGGMDEKEKEKLSNRKPHQVITLPTMATGQDVKQMLQSGPTAPVDPNLYEVESHFGDLMRVVGYQEAQIGATSGATATESSIAQQSHSVSQSDNVDDLDETLSELARAAGQVMLLNVPRAEVERIVGPGAAWPDAPETRSAAADEIMLGVKAGSTGRPNQAAELANVERAAPYLTQLPGVNPKPIVQKYSDLLNIAMEELYAEGMPSITAMNAMLAKGAVGPGGAPTGNPATDPNMQGAAGSQNAPGTVANDSNAQPEYNPSPA